MTNNVRLVLSVSEEDRSKLDKLSAELGMNRSQYVRYLLSGCSKLITPSMKYREFVKHFSQIDLSLRVIALKEEVSSEDKKVDTMCKKYIIVLSVIIILKVINTLLSVWIVVKTQ